MWQPGGGLVETPKYKPKELLKNELGDKFEDFLYDTNIELLELRDKYKEVIEEVRDNLNNALFGIDLDSIDNDELLYVRVGFFKELLRLLDKVKEK